MLKTEHLNYTITSGRVKPKFIDTAADSLLAAGSALLSFYEKSVPGAISRSELFSGSDAIVRSSDFPKICAGLNKLLFDRCRFTPPAQLDYPQLRRELFSKRGRELKNNSWSDDPGNTVDIYGDLPDFETLTHWEKIAVPELLELYNLATAQSLLLNAESVTLQISDPEITELRRVMKAIKFFRLLAEFRQEKKESVTINISGAYAIFGPVTKYAIALASLLPVICQCKKWKLAAQLRLKQRQVSLKLDERSGLISRNRSFSSIIPEEIRLYHRSFEQKSTLWQIVGETPFIDGGSQEIFFPDLSFKNRENGKVFHLELFHRYHAAQLPKRLEHLRRNPQIPLLIGIDRSLLPKGDSLENFLDHDPLLLARCWLFRDFPGVENTLRALKKIDNASPHPAAAAHGESGCKME